MNKRFSTLLGASLLLSSAFSVAVAENLPEAFASKKVYKLVRSAQSIDDANWTSNKNDEAYMTMDKDGNLSMPKSVDGKGSYWTVKNGAANGTFTLVNQLTNKELKFDNVSAFYSTDYSDGSIAEIAKSATNLNAFSIRKEATQTTAAQNLSYIWTSEDGITKIGYGLEAEDDETLVRALFHLEAVEATVGNAVDMAEAMNKVNEGSFSIDYRFDNNNIAEVNPFSGNVKAFAYGTKVYFATSWPASLNNVDVIPDEDTFKKCVFIVATLENAWNINNLREAGEGARFTEVKGDRLLASVDADDLKAGKYSRNNAAFDVTLNPVNDKYSLSLSDMSYLKDNSAKIAIGVWNIALIDDEAGLIVTTLAPTTEIDKVVLEGTITNSRTATVDEILSTEKASVFNIKFVSTTASSTADKTKSEYNKYFGVYGEFPASSNVTYAQGSEFVDLNAPENQWIISAADKDAKTVTFQNREIANQTITVELVKTDKENVYELRSKGGINVVDNFAYVNEDGEYTRFGSQVSLTGTKVELIPVTVNSEAGYVSTELDNAGLVRLMFNRTNESSTAVSEFYVTAEELATKSYAVKLDKEESEAAQFSVVKFDAASTATALSDTIYADNDYVIWDASNKKVKTINDGDSIAVVSYAFKQLRADGENYYLNSSMQVEKVADESEAPRFIVKLYKNGSYGLISVEKGDYFRDVVNVSATTMDLTSTPSIDVDGTSVYYDYTAKHLFDFNILKETPGTSYNHVPQHVTMEAVNGGYVAMNAENGEGIVAPVSTLKAEYTKEDLTFWLDTTDSEAVTPSFMISKAGKYMYNAVDSLNKYNEGTASAEKVEDFGIKINGTEYAKAIFQNADLAKVEDINNYKFQIVQSADNADEYVIKSLNGYKYVAAHNQKLYFTSVAKDALKVVVTPAEAPTSNEGVSASEVAVVAQNGSVVVKNAAGKNVVVSTILGQVVANEVLTSDNATINVPAGIVVVAVEGESFKVNVK